MDDLVKKYLQDKYGKNYDQDAQTKYDGARNQNRFAQLGSDLGDAIGGQKIGSGDAYFQNQNKLAKENTIGKIENDRNSYVKNQIESGQIQQLADKQENDAVRKNLNSSETKIKQALAKKMMPNGDFANLSAFQLDNMLPGLEKMYSVDQNNQARRDQMRIMMGQKEEAREQRQFEKDQKNEEKMQGLKTPFGLANTVDDAKKLKDGFESKQNFDTKLNELISLREEYGGEALNREAVARGKQLSKDLLLEYKNMAKLGVLSQSDENIINAIIPDDPLAFRSPLAAIQGQDPILNNLKKFKGDSDKDFETKVSTRTRSGVEGAAQPKKTIVKTQTNQKTGEKRIVYSDGSTELISSTAGR